MHPERQKIPQLGEIPHTIIWVGGEVLHLVNFRDQEHAAFVTEGIIGINGGKPERTTRHLYPIDTSDTPEAA